MSAPPTAEGKTRLLRVSMYVKRKAGMSEDDFNKHWSVIHAPLVSEWLARHGILRYTQYHCTPSLQALANEAWPGTQSMTRLPYDGCVEFMVANIESLSKMREDPFYHEKVMADEESFFETDPASLAWTVGWEEVYIAGGNVLGKGAKGVVTAP